MHHYLRYTLAVVLIPVSLFCARVPQARAGALKPEIWMSGGFVDASYHDSPLACARAGAGIEAFKHLTFGVCVQADRDRYFNFGYVGVVLPALGLFEPYGRFQAGRRDDLDDTALGWTAGLRVGNGTVNFLMEVHGVTQPGSSNGASVGVSF